MRLHPLRRGLTAFSYRGDRTTCRAGGLVGHSSQEVGSPHGHRDTATPGILRNLARTLGPLRRERQPVPQLPRRASRVAGLSLAAFHADELLARLGLRV